MSLSTMFAMDELSRRAKYAAAFDCACFDRRVPPSCQIGCSSIYLRGCSKAFQCLLDAMVDMDWIEPLLSPVHMALMHPCHSQTEGPSSAWKATRIQNGPAYAPAVSFFLVKGSQGTTGPRQAHRYLQLHCPGNCSRVRHRSEFLRAVQSGSQCRKCPYHCRQNLRPRP